MESAKIKASEYVYSILFAKIKSNFYANGDKLPSENEIAETYGVSRNSVRVAVNKLATLGYVESFQGKGTYVIRSNFSSTSESTSSLSELFREANDYVSITNLRMAIEVQAAGLTAINASCQQIEQLDLIVSSMVEHAEDLKKYCELDNQFHLLITEYCGNPLLHKLNVTLRAILRDIQYDLISDFGSYEGISSHQKILKAIKIANVKKARNATYKHIKSCIDRYAFLESPKVNID